MASPAEQPKRSMAEALLERPLLQQAPEERDVRHGIPLLTLMGFMLLTFSSAMAVSSWNTMFGAVSFVCFSYLDLVLLFYCLRRYGRTPPGSPQREHLKMAVWLLTTMLNVAFFRLLELWFLAMRQTDNSSDEPCCTACPHLQGSYLPSVP
ncbi:hypothetical protein BS78_04G087700 [Paspalum vaginatum]|uniref:Uncharacterized protein n=1 Tax=Paspalum vaginatum TaxID=158149 RepID=A0A9W7XC53_9POAL|nr:hypothetical protein BS78_K139000 [Paspalum vaginatum]KAJ1278542.1 hypothetical protein BS78_04G087700 [Paspalum vaginatum]